ncbi:MAG: DUF1684 domain-containing protein [Chitinophagaceae bacterium]
MKLFISSTLFILTFQASFSQNIYADSINRFITNYVQSHEVVTGEDKKLMSFYPVNEQYLIKARFEKIENGGWFSMETSGALKSINRVYGIMHFTINDTAVKLNIYQSQDLMNVTAYKEYLFLPFTDATTGEETYSGGRYIDLTIADIKNNNLVIDFNKAYNPYCAYVSGKYNCPIPPKENRLAVAIKAGEKTFKKSH